MHFKSAYCDADFAGLWHKDHSHKRESALSRTGSIICHAGCPVLWSSKLQTEVSHSTCEAECIALSSCAQAILPMRTILGELSVFQATTSHPTITHKQDDTIILSKQLQTPIYDEDNNGALEIAKQETQYGRNPHQPAPTRTKRISVKWHRFREAVQSKILSIHKLILLWADILTKQCGIIFILEPFLRAVVCLTLSNTSYFC